MSAEQEQDVGPPRWKVIGPGLIVAATGVGAGDLVATLVAGSAYGYALLWAAVLGAIIKMVLVEGAGRYSLASGNTIFEGWRTLGAWTTWYFAPYIVVWGFTYGATAMSSSALPLAALFPGVDLELFAIINGIIGLSLVWFGRYEIFEKIVAVLVGVLFVTVVGAAVVATPNIPNLLGGLRPTIPEGSLVTMLAVIGGVGGTITLAAYGYWLREKGWAKPRFMRVMRIDNAVAYTMTGVFVVAMLVMGAELLYATGEAVGEGGNGLVDLSEVLDQRYGEVFGKLFLVGFWAASFSSLIGVWNGVSLMFADYVGHLRKLEPGHAATRPGGRYFRWYVLWLTFPPMVLLWVGKPVELILAYGVLGAIFLPFLSVTLLWLLNTSRVPKQWRSRAFSNVSLVICAGLFGWLAIDQVMDLIQEYL